MDAQDASALLRQYGMRSTAATREVVMTLAGLPVPVTAKMLHSSLRQTRSDLATIHRILSKGACAGLFRTIHFRDRSHWYELAVDASHHHHLFCTHCRRIERYKFCFFDEIKAAALKEAGFSVLSHSVELYGTCRDCQTN